MYIKNDCKHFPRLQLIQYVNLYKFEYIINFKGKNYTVLQDIIVNTLQKYSFLHFFVF